MPTKSKLDIVEVIRDFLASNPGASPEAIQSMLKEEKGVTISIGLANLLKDLKAGSGRPSNGAPVLSKSQAIRDYLARNPKAAPKEIREALARKGIEVSLDLARLIRYSKQRRLMGRPKKAANLRWDPTVNRSQSIREFLALNPAANVKAIQAGLREKGIEVSPTLAGNTRYKWKQRTRPHEQEGR